MHIDPPPVNGTSGCSLFESHFRQARASLALQQVRNGLLAIATGRTSGVSVELVAEHCLANLAEATGGEPAPAPSFGARQ
jgi:hypothetical protein